jgi:hypothetical protein
MCDKETKRGFRCQALLRVLFDKTKKCKEFLWEE